MRDRPKVGEILVQAGIIDELQLAAALGEQSRWGRRLGMTLIKLGMVQEGQLVRALAKQFDLPVASLAGKKIPSEVIALVPAKVACEHSVVPLFVKQDGRKGQLFLGMEEPSDLGVLDDLAFRTGMMIRPVMVGPSEIGEAIDRYYTAKATTAPPAPLEPTRSGDTLSETNLRSLREEVSPPSEPTEAITAPLEPSAPVASVAPVVPVAPPIFVAPPTPSASVEAPAPAPRAVNDEIELERERERARLLDETERTRLVAKAIAHLLIEKGILTLEELQARIEKMKAKTPEASA